MPELHFTQRIGTRPQAVFPVVIATVEQAIEHVQELPPVMLGLDRWKPVSLALWDALDFPDDTRRLTIAGQMLAAALAAEGWLGETSPS